MSQKLLFVLLLSLSISEDLLQAEAKTYLLLVLQKAPLLYMSLFCEVFSLNSESKHSFIRRGPRQDLQLQHFSLGQVNSKALSNYLSVFHYSKKVLYLLRNKVVKEVIR